MFDVGVTVKLKSGGPLMTVAEADGDIVTCTWFDEKKVLQTGTFSAAMLVEDDGMPLIA